MIVHKQKPIKLVNTCNAIYDDKLVIKGMLDFISEPISRLHKVYMWGKYPAVSVREYKLHIHRVIWFAVNGGIPFDKYVHHKNGNKLDARIENLALIGISEHQSITNKGRKQTQEHINKRIDATTKTRYGHSIYEDKKLLR